jgi:1-acyl-sn-glycerol-3-phosphate acyltransferase
MNPKGGTEIQLEELTKRLPKHYWNKLSITTSVPEKTQIDPARLNILWQKNSYDQPNIFPWFSKPENHVKYDWYIFTHYVNKIWRAVIKAELRDFFIGGPMSEKTGQIFHAKGEGIDMLIEKCRPYIENGDSILMFPEGRRTRSEYLDEFQTGAFVMAAHFKIPLVPAVIVEEYPNNRAGLFGHKYWHNPGKIRFKVLPPLNYPGKSRKAAEHLSSKAHGIMLAEIKNAFHEFHS